RSARRGRRAAQAGRPGRDLRPLRAERHPQSGRKTASERRMTAVAPTTTSRTAHAIRLSGVSKIYGSGAAALLALDDVSLDVAPAEFVCLLGASGCGKSTLLNLVAGLDQPSAGTLDTAGSRVALMFQEPALFPWLTVSGNVELALRMRGMPRQD